MEPTTSSNNAYKLILNKKQQPGFLYGTLEAALLDRQMHPDGRVSVYFSTEFPERKDGGLTIDSFQLDSLRSYIADQSTIASALGEALVKDRSYFIANEKIDDPMRIWLHVAIDQVGFSPIVRVTTDSLSPLRKRQSNTKGLSDEFISKLVAESDPEGTVSKFIVVIKVDWSDESSPWREARFQNGDLVNIGSA